MARPRSFDRDHVLHAAERQFPGCNGTSVDDISAATGLGRGSIYAAFDGKHGVLLQAMAEYFARLAHMAPKMLVGPDEGAMACGEYGPGRMAEPAAIFDAIMTALSGAAARPRARS